MPKPTDLLVLWVPGGEAARMTSPSGAKRGVGWISGEKPAFQTMNYLQNNWGQWLAYFETTTDDHETRITDNATNIGTNANNIITNATNIGTNATNIGINVTDIGTNATNIGTNATNIESNISDIGTNASAIVVLQNRLDGYEASDAAVTSAVGNWSSENGVLSFLGGMGKINYKRTSPLALDWFLNLHVSVSITIASAWITWNSDTDYGLNSAAWFGLDTIIFCTTNAGADEVLARLIKDASGIFRLVRVDGGDFVGSTQFNIVLGVGYNIYT